MMLSLDKYLEEPPKRCRNCAAASIRMGCYFCPKQNRYVADDDYCEEYE